MFDSQPTRHTEPTQNTTAGIQKSSRAKQPLQRTAASPYLPSYTQAWGNQPPPWLRLGGDEQPPHEEENTEPIQKKENKTGLPDNLKAGVENLSGLSMDDVHVHYNSPKAAEVQALAYTQGTEIHVGPGQEKHLGHEAWHVVQQKQGRVRQTLLARGAAINDDPGLEGEANVMGAKVNQIGSKSSERKGASGSRSIEINSTLPLYLPQATHAVAQNSVIQREIWFDETNGTIDPESRIPRPSGTTKGAHTTAFQLFVEGVEENIKGKTYQGALTVFSKMMKDLEAMPGYNKKDQKQADLFSELDSWIKFGKRFKMVVPNSLSTIIDRIAEAYLKARNSLSYTYHSGGWGSTKGKNEAKHFRLASQAYQKFPKNINLATPTQIQDFVEAFMELYDERNVILPVKKNKRQKAFEELTNQLIQLKAAIITAFPGTEVIHKELGEAMADQISSKVSLKQPEINTLNAKLQVSTAGWWHITQ